MAAVEETSIDTAVISELDGIIPLNNIKMALEGCGPWTTLFFILLQTGFGKSSGKHHG